MIVTVEGRGQVNHTIASETSGAVGEAEAVHWGALKA